VVIALLWCGDLSNTTGPFVARRRKADAITFAGTLPGHAIEKF
jgi:hypothetical protein